MMRPVRPTDRAGEGAGSNTSSGDCRARPQTRAALPEAAKVRRVVLCVSMPGLPCRHWDATLIISRFALRQQSLAAAKGDLKWSIAPWLGGIPRGHSGSRAAAGSGRRVLDTPLNM